MTEHGNVGDLRGSPPGGTPPAPVAGRRSRRSQRGGARAGFLVLAVLVIASGVISARAVLDAPSSEASGGPGVVVGGERHTCALSPASHVWCWGNNAAGQLGTGDLSARNQPAFAAAVNGADGAQRYMALAAGDDFTCAITVEFAPGTGGGVRCWGDNAAGQLGNGATTTSTAPVTPVGLDDSVRSISATNRHVCVIKINDEVWCWGNNASGQIGTGSTSPAAVTTPARATEGPPAALEVSAGLGHTCALSLVGAVTCWGDNTFGQLGTGDTTQSPEASDVVLPSSAVHLAAGETVSCAALVGGTAVCWGAQLYGALGDGVEDNTFPNPSVLGPTEVKTNTTTALGGVTQVSAGRSTVCAVTNSVPGVYCWGLSTTGETGAGVFSNRPFATAQLGAPLAVSSIGVGWNHGCRAVSAGSMQCWGLGTSGQLGGGPTGNIPFPGNVAATPYLQVSPRQLDFAPRVVNTASAAQTLTLTNASFGPVALSEPAVSGAFAQFIANDDCGSLAFGQSCNYSIIFHPTAIGGVINGTLNLTANNAAPQSVSLAGAAVADAAPVVESATASQRWTLGGGPVQLSATATGSDPSNLTYTWSAPGVGAVGTTPQVEVSPQLSTTYTLTVNDSGSPTATSTKTVNVMVFTGNTAGYIPGGVPGEYPALQQYTGMLWETQDRGVNQSASVDFVPVTGPSCGSACAAQGVILKGQLSTGPNAATVLKSWVQVTWVSSTNQVLVRSVFRDGLLYRTPATVNVNPAMGVVDGIDTTINGSAVSVTVRGTCDATPCTQSFNTTLPNALTVLGEPQWSTVGGRSGVWGKNATPGGLQITRFQSSES